MNEQGLTIGYSEFPPIATAVIYADEMKSLTGKSHLIKRETVDIVWVRQTRSVAYLSFKGKLVRKFETLWDFYGLLSSSKGQIEDAPGRAENWGIERTSELEYHVMSYIEDYPTLGYVKTDWGRRYYRDFDQAIFRDTADAKVGQAFNFDNFPFESRVAITTKQHGATVVWKSSSTDAENETAFSAFEQLVRTDKLVFTETGIEIPD